MYTTTHKITSVELIQPDKDQWVYDIEMLDNPHNFFANDILVHNSLFVQLTNNDDSFLKHAMEDYIEEYKKDVVLFHNCGLLDDYFIMQLQHQKTLSHIYFGDKKKRYYGIQTNGKKYIRGINVIRKDCPLFLRDKLNYLIQMAIKQEITIDQILQIRNSVQNAPYSQIGIFKRFGMPFDMYVKNIPQTLKSAL